MIISIDGPAGSGKSTVAEILAQKLGFVHFNSGSLYRGIASYLHSINFDFSQITVDFPIFQLTLEVKFINNEQNVFVNGKNQTEFLRDNTISTLAPFVSTNESIRQIVDNCQRAFCSKNNSIIDGRDIGSHVFPNAEYKFYLDCSVQERARRRFLEVKEKDKTITIKDIEKQLEERDLIDKNKRIAPLIVPKNAIIIDSSTLSIEEVTNLMRSQIK